MPTGARKSSQSEFMAAGGRTSSLGDFTGAGGMSYSSQSEAPAPRYGRLSSQSEYVHGEADARHAHSPPLLTWL